ncbi:MAG: GNAT family N-acetyltransferase [Acidimicrobiales bacterium]
MAAPASAALGLLGEPRLLGHLNLIEQCRESTRWGRGGALEESAGVLLFATGSWLPVSCNGAFRVDDGTGPDDVVGRADDFFRARKRGYGVKTRDLSVDDDLRRACAAAGMVTLGEPAPEMICTAPVDPACPSDIDIRHITTTDGVADFAAVTGSAYRTYGMPVETAAELLSRPDLFVAAPHIVTVVAHDAEGPVAGALTLLSHGVAGVYWVGTLERARRRGLGRAVTAAVTNAAFDRGAAAVTLQASVMGAPVYRAMGYEVLYHYEDWVRFDTRPGRLSDVTRAMSSAED